jgi:hypothetical protein
MMPRWRRNLDHFVKNLSFCALVDSLSTARRYWPGKRKREHPLSLVVAEGQKTPGDRDGKVLRQHGQAPVDRDRVTTCSGIGASLAKWEKQQ